MNAKTIPTKRRSRGVVASYFLIFAFLFVVIVGVVADVQYSRGYEAGKKESESAASQELLDIIQDLMKACDITLP